MKRLCCGHGSLCVQGLGISLPVQLTQTAVLRRTALMAGDSAWDTMTQALCKSFFTMSRFGFFFFIL